jgi:hypothetical protein
LILTFCLQDAEGEDLAKIMMSKKTKRLYGRMQHGIEKKEAAVAALESKRKALESAASTAGAGKGKGGKGQGGAAAAKKQRRA